MIEKEIEMEEKITVIDSLMGTGKTSWAISELLDKKPDKRVMYITPYLSEISRIMKSTERDMYTPSDSYGNKLSDIVKLLSQGKDIISTHALFRRFDESCKTELKKHKYTLILDEALNAVEKFTFQHKGDFDFLLEKGQIAVRENGLIEWIGSDLDIVYDEPRRLMRNKCLFRIDQKFYVWQFPREIFDLFDRIYILTYLFEGSVLKYYFDLHKLTYQIKSVKQENGKYKLVDYYYPDKRQYRDRLDVYDGALNDVGKGRGSLSKSWYSKRANKKYVYQIKNNIYNYIRHVVHAKSDAVMWTVHKQNVNKLSGNGYSKGFVACNCRATNEFNNTTCLVYGLNWFVQPELQKYFQANGISIDQDKIALANLLQWIWRSNIRLPESEKIIRIYIPSLRMRKLFLNWLNT